MVSGAPTVFAASSLTEAFRSLDPTATYAFAGSDQLAFQITQGAPADVFAAASPRYPLRLQQRGLAGRPRTFATNALVVIVPRANPARITAPQQVAAPGVKLLIGAPGLPLGDYTRAALARMGLLKRALGNVVSNEDTAKGVVTKVALAEADAGIVYATDARAAGGRVRTLRLPASAQPDVEYQVVTLTGSSQPRAARAFVARLFSQRGGRVLAAHGFGLPSR